MNKKKDTFTRSDIEASLKKEFSNLTKQEISQAIDIILDSIIESVALDEKVEIRGFGSFCIRDRKSIRARNPKSGQSIELPKRSIPYFRASKLLKERIN